MQTNPQHRKLSISFALLSLEGEEGKVRKKKMNVSRTKRAFYMKWKPFFILFEGLPFDGKIRNSRH